MLELVPVLLDLERALGMWTETDAGDIVSLFALSTAAEGGTSRLASTWRVYNELAATRPDLLETLSEPWLADRSDDVLDLDFS